MKGYYDKRLIEMIENNETKKQIKREPNNEGSSDYFEAMVRLFTLKRFLIDINFILETEISEITSLFEKSKLRINK